MTIHAELKKCFVPHFAIKGLFELLTVSGQSAHHHLSLRKSQTEDTLPGQVQIKIKQMRG